MTARPRVSFESLRSAIQKRVDETNLRETAIEIGMKSHSALARFLDGRTKQPQRDTLNRMMAWYYARSETPARVQREDVEIAKSILSAWAGALPKAVQERELANAFEEIRKSAEKH